MSGLASFLPVQVDGTELSRHDKVVKMAKSRLTGQEVSCQGVLYKWQSKKS